MPRRCKRFSECGAEGVVRVPYAGLTLCSDHFVEYVESRVEKTVERYHFLSRRGARERWAVAMSGGKDSQVLAKVLAKRFEDSLELVGLHLDLGIEPNEYSRRSREVVEATCEELGIPLHVVDLAGEHGFTTDHFHRPGGGGSGSARRLRSGAKDRRRGSGDRRRRRGECSACGLVKRYLLNKAAVGLGVDKVATGHNLTDEATTLLSNLLLVDLDALSRGRPWSARKEVVGGPPDAALVPRVKPLYETSEEEVLLYAVHANLPFVEVECPYAAHATSTSTKRWVLAMEGVRPGTMLGLVRGYQKRLLPLLEREVGGGAAPLTSCGECGQPTSTPVCAFCRLKAKTLGPG
ncbi:MAG: TIGR00269 family protein [Promethearchaeota archaeon]